MLQTLRSPWVQVSALVHIVQTGGLRNLLLESQGSPTPIPGGLLQSFKYTLQPAPTPKHPGPFCFFPLPLTFSPRIVTLLELSPLLGCFVLPTLPRKLFSSRCFYWDVLRHWLILSSEMPTKPIQGAGVTHDQNTLREILKELIKEAGSFVLFISDF